MLGALAALFVVVAFLFVWPGLVEYLTTGGTHLHWSRLLAGAFCLFSAAQPGVFIVLLKTVELWRAVPTNAGRRTMPATPVPAPGAREAHSAKAKDNIAKELVSSETLP